MQSKPTQMRREIDEIPAAVARMLAGGSAPIRDAAEKLNSLAPGFLVTIARGSSDHVCTYLKYVSEILLGLPVASIGPSVASIYQAPLRLSGSACLSISQSGQSPDIVAMARASKRDGAFTIAVTNDLKSPLAGVSDTAIDICAGPERSVAATKTFVTSAAAGLYLLAAAKNDVELIGAIKALPETLEKAAQIDWPEVRAAVGDAPSLYTLGRGPSWAISNEAALKFKETCQIHAESFSSAEVLHGPVSIVGEGFPVLGFASADKAETALTDVADTLAAKGAKVFVTSKKARAANVIEHVRTGHALADPLSLIVSFYAMVERFATSQGIDPDTPRHLAKVTETL